MKERRGERQLWGGNRCKGELSRWCRGGATRRYRPEVAVEGGSDPGALSGGGGGNGS